MKNVIKQIKKLRRITGVFLLFQQIQLLKVQCNFSEQPSSIKSHFYRIPWTA